MTPTGNRADRAELDIWSEQQTSRVQYEPFRVESTTGSAAVVGTWGYRRHVDFDSVNSRGQDYCAVRGGSGFVVGIVADGVGQSYYGDIAAREVSRHLIDFLWQRRAEPPSDRELEGSLLRLAEQVHPEVQQRRPANPALEEAMAPVRERQGSQSVFAAFILDFRDRNRDLSLYQVGDIYTWVFDCASGRQAEKADPNGRWSSHGQSALRLRSSTLHAVTGCVIHSDGLGPRWTEAMTVPRVSEEAFQAEAEERARVDDLSFIALEISDACEDRVSPGAATRTTSPTVAILLRAPEQELAEKAPPEVEDPPPGIARESVAPAAPRVRQPGRGGGDTYRSASVGRSAVRIRTPSSLTRYWRAHRLPLLGGFVTGVILGAGALLLLTWHVPAVRGPGRRPPPFRRAAAKVPPRAPIADPKQPGPETPAVPGLAVTAKRLGQHAFFDRAGYFPAQGGREDGDIVARIESESVAAFALKVAADPDRCVVQRCPKGRDCYLVLITGRASGRKKVLFEAVDGHGIVVGRGQASLEGRQPQAIGSRRFLGYYDIDLRPAGKSGGDL